MNIREPGGQIPGKMHWNANKPIWLHWRVQKHQIRVHATNCPTLPSTPPHQPPSSTIQGREHFLTQILRRYLKTQSRAWKRKRTPRKGDSSATRGESAVHLPLNNPLVTPLIKAAHVGWMRVGYRRKIYWAPQSKPALSVNPCVPSSKPWVPILRTSVKQSFWIHTRTRARGHTHKHKRQKIWRITAEVRTCHTSEHQWKDQVPNNNPLPNPHPPGLGKVPAAAFNASPAEDVPRFYRSVVVSVSVNPLHVLKLTHATYSRCLCVAGVGVRSLRRGRNWQSRLLLRQLMEKWAELNFRIGPR